MSTVRSWYWQGVGSGKTRVITRRGAHLLSTGIPSDRILALTFTNKAAGEDMSGIDALVPDSRVLGRDFSSAFVLRMLRKYSPLVGTDTSFSIYDRKNDRLKAGSRT